MSWTVIAIGCFIALTLAIWWLERPLWHRCEGIGALDGFLRALVSPRFSGSQMTVRSRNGCELLFFRTRHDTDTFNLRLEACVGQAAAFLKEELTRNDRDMGLSSDQVSVGTEPEGSRISIDFGRANEASLEQATHAIRLLGKHLGISEKESIYVRYPGPSDPLVVRPALEKLATQGGAVGRILAKAGLKHLDEGRDRAPRDRAP